MLPVLLLGWPVVSSAARAADPGLVLGMTRVAPGPDATMDWFGNSVAGGDLDGDGYSDVIVAGAGEVLVAFGSPRGLEPGDPTILAQWYDYNRDFGFFGASVDTADLDGDGNHELLVGSNTSLGGVSIYDTNSSGVLLPSEKLLTPLEAGTFENPEYGYALANAGDVDGDGLPEILVGAYVWVDPDETLLRASGAAFLYSADDGAVDRCSERRIPVPSFESGVGQFLSFGFTVAAAGDTDHDGYGDFTVTCPTCGIPDCLTCGYVAVYSGGSVPDISPEAPQILASEDGYLYWYSWNAFGAYVDGAGDVNGDDYDDLIVGGGDSAYLFYGSPSGLDATTPSRDGRLWPGFHVSGIGDLDGDGFDDVVVSGGDGMNYNPNWPTLTLSILFGGEDGLDTTWALPSPAVSSGYGFGNEVARAGDVNGDGHPDFVVGAQFEGLGLGAGYLISPVCTWYLDADADGFGDPASSVTDCHDQPSYVARPDDCDDADAAVHGSVWYPDLDGDGYGTKAAGGQLACTQPENTASTWTDCDDTDPARSPGGVDDNVDGVDQDCDDHDGAWDRDSGDCSEDTGDTAPADSGDSGADTAPVDSAAPSGDEPGPPPSADPDCGCAESPYAGRNSMWVSGVLSVAVLTRRRRGPKPA